MNSEHQSRIGFLERWKGECSRASDENKEDTFPISSPAVCPIREVPFSYGRKTATIWDSYPRSHVFSGDEVSARGFLSGTRHGVCLCTIGWSATTWPLPSRNTLHARTHARTRQSQPPKISLNIAKCFLPLVGTTAIYQPHFEFFQHFWDSFYRDI